MVAVLNRCLEIGFNFKYFDKLYTKVCVNQNGYVCLGEIPVCGGSSRPSPQDILVGLNYELDQSRIGSGNIYFQSLSVKTSFYNIAKTYVNFIDNDFLPTNVFMITYDSILPKDKGSTSTTSFQIFISTDSNLNKSFVTFKYNSCPQGITLLASSGINSVKKSFELVEVLIDNGLQCTGSNVEQTGVWVSEVTNFSAGLNLI
jgi:hypothetical protein